MLAIDPRPPDYPDSDRLKQLRSFCQVVRWRSFTRAAEHLGLSQSSVSQQVRSLEEEFAAALFERDGRHVTLTSAGEDLYRLAASLVAGMDRLPDTFAEEHTGRLPPELRIGAGEAAAAFILPPFLKQFRDAHPGTRLSVKSGTGREGIKRLYDYEVDLIVGATDTTPDGLEFRPLFSCDHVLIVPLDHPLAGRESVEPSEAATYPVIMSTRGTRTRQFSDFLHGALGVTPKAVVEVDGWETAKLYVETGIGISIIPDFCLTEQDQVSVIPLSRHFRERGYWMYARPRSSHQSPAIERFIRFVSPPPPPPPPPRESTAAPPRG